MQLQRQPGHSHFAVRHTLMVLRCLGGESSQEAICCFPAGRLEVTEAVAELDPEQGAKPLDAKRFL
jgi:hypothetical protein